MQRIRSAMQLPWGILIMTGPTGSGKTTTLYSALNDVNAEQTKVLSIEDPVEYALPGIVQVQINPKTGLTFARAIRAALRSDPDVLMVGEIRDAEMLNLCCQAALTGHLVLTTLHTDTAVSAIRRVIDIGIEPFLASDAIKLIIAQRLVRVLCPDCSKPFSPNDTLLQEAQVRARTGGLLWEQLPNSYRKATGCAKCGNIGYLGRRTPVVETMAITPEIVSAIRRRASDKEIQTIAVAQGMTTMAADGIRRAAEGKVSLEEVLFTAPRE
jgi:type II secretory ATPase GspE/PulE/Tfp pilus assembly ATPase PilB-like protein